MIEVLSAKIHRATITDSNIEYEGSITISQNMIKQAGMYPYQKVLVVDIDNGNRFETYIIPSQEAGVVCINGAAARLVCVKDKVIIMAFQYVENIPQDYTPICVKVDEKNNMIL